MHKGYDQLVPIQYDVVSTRYKVATPAATNIRKQTHTIIIIKLKDSTVCTPIIMRYLPALLLPVALVTAVCLPFSAAGGNNKDKGPGPVVALQAPPMGFMSWERFRCQIDCAKFPKECINENLYMEMGTALVQGGYAAAGYKQVSIDDCWTSGRDPSTHELLADPHRFPSGIPALAKFLHDQDLQLGIYGDAGTLTCGGYAGSQGYEQVDAQTFAEWGVDYLKLDGCYVGDFAKAYQAFGQALRMAGPTRPIVFSCSWPAYLGSNESAKPYHDMYYEAGCNTWRNYGDIDNTWDTLLAIIMHWAEYWKDLQAVPQGSVNDADMLLIGDDHHGKRLPLNQAQVQMTFWAMIANPLFIAADVRTIPDDYGQILKNAHVIAINQDASLRQAGCVVGCRGTPQQEQQQDSNHVQVWSKSLQSGESHALAFFNLNNNSTSSSIVYTFPVQGAIARCVDLWSPDPETDVCDQGRGATTELWDIRVITDNDNNNKDDQVFLQIHALNVPPTSQRLLRIDYFCSSTTATTTSENDTGIELEVD